MTARCVPGSFLWLYVNLYNNASLENDGIDEMSALWQTKGAPGVPGAGSADLRRLLRHEADDRNSLSGRLPLSRHRARASACRDAAPATAGSLARRSHGARLEPPPVGAAVSGTHLRGSLRSAARGPERVSRVGMGADRRR